MQQDVDADNLHDCQTAIANAMKANKQANAMNQIEITQEPMHRQVAKALGETTAEAQNQNGNDNDDDDDDDDDYIEVVPNAATQGTAGSGNSCKCPITGCHMDDAVKSKVC